MVFALAGCTGGSTDSTSSTSANSATTTPDAGGKKLRIGMVFDSGGRGDKSFNDSAYAGLERAEKELGVEIQTVDSKAEKDYTINLTTLAEQKFDVIFAIGITQGEALTAVAPKFPRGTKSQSKSSKWGSRSHWPKPCLTGSFGPGTTGGSRGCPGFDPWRERHRQRSHGPLDSQSKPAQ